MTLIHHRSSNPFNHDPHVYCHVSWVHFWQQTNRQTAQIIQLTWIFIIFTPPSFGSEKWQNLETFLDNRPDTSTICVDFFKWYFRQFLISIRHAYEEGGWKLMSHFDTFFHCDFTSSTATVSFSHLLLGMLFCLGGGSTTQTTWVNKTERMLLAPRNSKLEEFQISKPTLQKQWSTNF